MAKKTKTRSKQRGKSLSERIEHERLEMRLNPWQFAPSEIDDGPCPYSHSSIGAESWKQAQRWRAEIRKRDPEYFDE